MAHGKETNTYLVCNVVGEPVKTLVQTFSCGSTSALDIPTSRIKTQQIKNTWSTKNMLSYIKKYI